METLNHFFSSWLKEMVIFIESNTNPKYVIDCLDIKMDLSGQIINPKDLRILMVLKTSPWR